MQETKISNESKAKVFAMYLGQPFNHEYHTATILHSGNFGILFRNGNHKTVKLQLRTIEDLTDEELIEACKIEYGEFYNLLDNSIKLIKDCLEKKDVNFKCVDYLRSIGVDWETLHLNGQTLIEAGIAERKEGENE